MTPLWQGKHIISINFHLLNSDKHEQLIREEDNDVSVFTLCLERILPHYRFLSLAFSYNHSLQSHQLQKCGFCIDMFWRAVKGKNMWRVVHKVTDNPKIMSTFPMCSKSCQFQQTVVKRENKKHDIKTHLPYVKYMMYFWCYVGQWCALLWGFVFTSLCSDIFIYIITIKVSFYSCAVLQPTWDASALGVSQLPLRALSPSTVTINLTLAAAQQHGWARDTVNKEGRDRERHAFPYICHGIFKSPDAHSSGCFAGKDWTLARTCVHEEAVTVMKYCSSVWT